MQLTLTGFHTIEEAVKKATPGTKETDFKLFYSEPTGPRVKKILNLAKEKALQAKKVETSYLQKLTASLPEALQNHRGVVLVYTAKKLEQTLESFLATKAESSIVTVAMLDHIIDPHNVGAILRSADLFSVDALLVTEHKSAGDYSTISKISSGAFQFVPVIKVKNLNQAALTLQKQGFLLYGADLDGTALSKTDFANRTCIVLGSEGTGIGESLKSKLDAIITIPTAGHIDSLNVSNAAAIFFYERAKKLNNG